jgi:DNA polymerase III subunit gamma/tau
MSALDQVIAFSGQTVRDEDVAMLLGLVEPAILGNMIRAIAANDSSRILNIISELAVAGQDLQNFCRCLLGQLRDLMVLKAGVTELAVLGVPESMLGELSERAALFSREDLLRLFDALIKVEADLRFATQTRFQLEMGLIELAQIPRMRSLEELIADFQQLVKGGPAPEFGSQRQGTSIVSSTRPPEARIEPALQERAPAQPATPVAQAPPAAASAPPSLSPPMASGSIPDGGSDPKLLVEQIASAVQKESLEPILHSLPGAKIRGHSVILDLGHPPNEFLRRQLKDNLPVIAQAASRVLGRTVQVFLDDVPAEATKSHAEEPPAIAIPQKDLLERAKKDPTVQSFLDIFPGPVKTEKI